VLEPCLLYLFAEVINREDKNVAGRERYYKKRSGDTYSFKKTRNTESISRYCCFSLTLVPLNLQESRRRTRVNANAVLNLVQK